jgi:hypothetical protein
MDRGRNSLMLEKDPSMQIIAAPVGIAMQSIHTLGYYYGVQ